MNQYARERIANPAGFFDGPDDVLNDPDLKPEEREKVLRSMIVDAERMVDAPAEGMTAAQDPTKAEELRRALTRLSDLKAGTEPGTNTPRHLSTGFQRIVVVTTINQELNRIVLDHAVALASLSGGRLSLLGVVPPSIHAVGPASGVAMAGSAQIVSVDQTEARQERTNLLQELRAASNADDRTEIAVRLGQIEEEVVNFATEIAADVIVVGSPNKSWFAELFDPAIDRSVTRFAPCPVLVVPEPESE
jgi:nucleotide-binding universal stress UspA family protein